MYKNQKLNKAYLILKHEKNKMTDTELQKEFSPKLFNKVEMLGDGQLKKINSGIYFY